MYPFLVDPRSDNDYGESDYSGPEPATGCADFLQFIFLTPVVFIFMLIMMAGLIFMLAGHILVSVYEMLKKTVQTGELVEPFFARAGVVLALVLIVANGNKPITVTPGLIVATGFILIYTILPIAALGLRSLMGIFSDMKIQLLNPRSPKLYLTFLIALLGAVLLLNAVSRPGTPNTTHASAPVLIKPRPSPSATQRLPEQVVISQTLPTRTSQPRYPTPPVREISILVDDFKRQPYPGDASYRFNRLEGDRGPIVDSILDWGNGQVTATVSSTNSWAGVWMSLNHPLYEAVPISFSAILPAQIVPAYQSQITGITVVIVRGTPNRTFRLELKDSGEFRWTKEFTLNGGRQVVTSDLPALGNVNHLVWVIDHAAAGDDVVLERVSFTATTQITDTATAAFVWSYSQLLNNWNPVTGLVRDKATDASGEFDAIQATGSLAAATAEAEQLGVISHTDAIRIVDKISDTLLTELPRLHGLWPHFVVSQTGVITIAPTTEWSSVDTAIAATGLLAAQSGLGLDTSSAEQMLQAIDWEDLTRPTGMISFGYDYAGNKLSGTWDVFGGESWLVELAYASATGHVTPLAYPLPPTANGSGFIDELAWLFVLPSSRLDDWAADWAAYRLSAVDKQVGYYPVTDPASCFSQLGLFGLSAAEVPAPSLTPANSSVYQAFGVGGRFASANAGVTLFGTPVVVPHESAMIASLRPQAAIPMWDWLIQYGHFSPLNNVESLMFLVDSNCDPDTTLWNHLKGSWNLSLQSLGWGRYLAERNGQVPSLWQATMANSFLRRGYFLLVPNRAYLPMIVHSASSTISASPRAGE